MAFSKTFQKCSGPFTLVQEIGTVQTYEAPGGTVHVRDGKIVAWSSSSRWVRGLRAASDSMSGMASAI